MISELTPAQEKLLPVVRDEWLGHGLSTEPADRATAERGVDLAYGAAGLAPPRLKLWLRSPLEGLVAAVLFRQKQYLLPLDHAAKATEDVAATVASEVFFDVQFSTATNIGGSIRAGVLRQVHDQLHDQILFGDQVARQFREIDPVRTVAALRDQVADDTARRVREKAWQQAWQEVQAQASSWIRQQAGKSSSRVANALWDPLWEHLLAQLVDQTWGSVWNIVQEQAVDHVYRASYGQHDSGWLSFYDFFDRIGLTCTHPLRGLFLVAKSAGWWWPMRDICILTERHTTLHRDERGQLHCEDGPALAYPDGWSIWAIHGVRVPAQVVLAPHSLSVEAITTEMNNEVRRIAIERFGPERFMRQAGAMVIHADKWGTLYRLALPHDEDMVMVRVKNSTPEPDGSFREYWLRVHPELRPMREDGWRGAPQKPTALNAIASTFGMTGKYYATHLVVQT